MRGPKGSTICVSRKLRGLYEFYQLDQRKNPKRRGNPLLIRILHASIRLLVPKRCKEQSAAALWIGRRYTKTFCTS